jgi:hypothetical protein
MMSSMRTIAIFLLAMTTVVTAQTRQPEVWMGPPMRDEGRTFRALFAHPEQWAETRSLIDVLFCTDLHTKKIFTDDEELRRIFAQMKEWKLKFGMEVGAIKPWGLTGADCFAKEKPLWDRVQKLGGDIFAIAMDEPLCCCRFHIKKPDEYALEETANYIACVRTNFPNIRIGDIETYPSIPIPDHIKWIEALEKRLAEKKVRGLDFYRLDVNWICFTAQTNGSWKEVRQLEQFCRQRKLPFSLIYWAAGYPGLQRKGLADDSTWYTAIMQQGYDYAFIDGKPDQYVIESWIGVPSNCVPEAADFTFTRSVRDFVRKFVKRTP